MKKQITLIFLLLLLNLGFLSAQDLTSIWVKTLNGGNSDLVADETILTSISDGNGNIIITGFYKDTIDLDPGTDTLTYVSTNGNRELFIMKLDSLGELIWVKTLVGNSAEYGYNMEIDASGNIFLAGMFWETVDFDPGPGVENRTALNNERDGFLLKLTENGDFIWVQVFSGPGTDSAGDLFIDENGDLYVLGLYFDTIDVDPGPGVFTLSTSNNRCNFLVKLNSEGDFLWGKNITEGGQAYMKKMTRDSNGNIYFGGSSGGIVDFDSGPGETILEAEGSDICMMKVSAAGDFIWARVFGGSDADECNDIICDSNDDIIITGEYRQMSDFDPGPDVYNLPIVSIGYEVFVAKYSGDGDLIWAGPVYGQNSEFCNSLDIDENDNIYMTGFFAETTDFDPGPEVHNVSANFGDLFILKLSPTGDFIWVETYGGDGKEGGGNILFDNDNIYITDLYEIPFTIDGNDNTMAEVKGNFDLMIMRFKQCSEINEAPVPVLADLPNLEFACSVESLDSPQATNSCGDPISGTTDVVFPITEIGITVVTWTYTNSFGMQITQEQQVTLLEDTEAPVPDLASLNDVLAQCVVTDLVFPTATDNCSDITVTHDAALPITEQGVSVVTWTYSDENGNSSTQLQTIIVEDTAAPVTDVVVLEDVVSECSLEIIPVAPTATDDCAGIITGVTDAVFPITTIGTTTITWTFDDGNENVTTQTQDIIINAIDNSISQDQNILSANAVGYSYQWIDCDNGNQPIDGETNQNFITEANGNYAVIIGNGTCSVTSECVEVIVTSIEEMMLSNLTIYPNPASDFIIIDKEGIDEMEIEVVDLNGKTLKKLIINERQNKISISDLPPGSYIVNASLNGAVKHFRIVKL